MSNLKKIFSKNFNRIWKASGLRKKDLVALTGLDYAHFWNYEHGMAIPTPKNLELIIHALRCTRDDLYEEGK